MRNTINKDNKEVAYGLDRVPTPGYFLQVFDEEDNLVEDLDTRAGMSEKQVHRTEIAERMKELGAPEEDVQRILLDMPM